VETSKWTTTRIATKPQITRRLTRWEGCMTRHHHHNEWSGRKAERGSAKIMQMMDNAPKCTECKGVDKLMSRALALHPTAVQSCTSMQPYQQFCICSKAKPASGLLAKARQAEEGRTDSPQPTDQGWPRAWYAQSQGPCYNTMLANAHNVQLKNCST
jgi:hypothetical protein